MQDFHDVVVLFLCREENFGKTKQKGNNLPKSSQVTRDVADQRRVEPNLRQRPLKEGSPRCSRDEDILLFSSVFHKKAAGRRNNRVTGIAKLEEANEEGGVQKIAV